KTSDDPMYAGKTVEMKVVELDDASLVLQSPKLRPARYTRGQKSDPKAGGKGAGVTKEELHGAWESIDVTLVGGATALDLRSDGPFKLEHRDVAVGWTTTVSGTWEL